MAIADGIAYLGVTPGTIVALDAADGTLRWSRRLANEGDVMTPSVSDDLLYVALGGTSAGQLWALDPATGDPLREYAAPVGVTGDGQLILETGAAIGSPATVAGDVLYLASQDELVYAIDPRTREVLWTARVDGWPGTPVAADGCLIVGTEYGQLIALAEAPSAGR